MIESLQDKKTRPAEKTVLRYTEVYLPENEL